jgi:SAM-dependent methyltransferase
MGFIGGALGYHLLRFISEDGETGLMDGSAYIGKSKLEILIGQSIWNQIAGKTVIDFGCGPGSEAVEMATRGAKHVIGLDIQEHLLLQARKRAEEAGVADRCEFLQTTNQKADVITAIDSFEHFDDPAAILRIMRSLLKDDGRILIAFGPTWYHPLGGHLFSVFPWAHLIFTEKALIRWRSDFKTDGATRFREVGGGLNQMTISKFEHILKNSDFNVKEFELVPIRRLKPIANKLTREITTSIVRCTLIPR